MKPMLTINSIMDNYKAAALSTRVDSSTRLLRVTVADHQLLKNYPREVELRNG
jgi:hypothetical protein